MATSRKAIFDAADALDAGGQRPTLAALLGGRWRQFHDHFRGDEGMVGGQGAREAPVREPAARWSVSVGRGRRRNLGAGAASANERLAGERETFDVARVQASKKRGRRSNWPTRSAPNSNYCRGRSLALEEAERTARQEAATLREHWRRAASAQRRLKRVLRKSKGAL